MPIQTELIFLGGVHCVGKSTLASYLAEAMGAKHLVASTLIRDAGGIGARDVHKHTDGIDENQKLLVKEVRKRRQCNGLLILDGHYVLEKSPGRIIEISAKVFRELQPSVLLVLTAEPTKISARLKSRDNVDREPNDIAIMQSREVEHARDISATLAIQLIEITSQNEKSALDGIRDALGFV